MYSIPIYIYDKIIFVLWYLYEFSRAYGGNKKIGEVFFRALTDITFQSATSKFPFIRSACLAANLIAPKSKVIDGVARLLTKTDLIMLSNKKKILQVTAGEELLAEVWKQLNESDIESTARNNMFGRLSSRIILFLLNKQKDGVEDCNYKKLVDIKASFTAEFQAGGHIASKKTPVQRVAEPASFDDVSDPKWLVVTIFNVQV